MRMTNKIMQNNSLYNINNNKQLVDKLSTMMSTNKKITRPSDDPVIAVRALRLRSDVAQVAQYHEKNAEDAASWLKVTEDSLNTTTEVIRKMMEQATRAAGGKDLDCGNLEIIVTQLKSLRDEYYGIGNVDFAGRYIFTGFRTDTSLSYTEDTEEEFKIYEKLDMSAVDTLNYTSIGNLKGISKENYDPEAAENAAAGGTPLGGTAGGETENSVQNTGIYRIMLSYDNLKNNNPPASSLSVKYVTNTTMVPPQEQDLFPAGTIVNRSTTEDPNPYDYIQQNSTQAVLVPETGELLIGKDLYETVFQGKAVPPLTAPNPALTTDSQIRVSYEKNSWKKGDMRPQHYFECTKVDLADPTKNINYNWSKDKRTDPPTDYISMEGESQIIEYDVGYNQTIRINTVADEVFSMDMDRVIDDLDNALSKLKEIDTARTNLKHMMENMKEGEPGYEHIKETYAAADKAYTYIRDNMQKKVEKLISQVEGFQSYASVAITDNGTRSDRLDLIKNRLETQKTTFKTLQSANEDIDVTEVTVQLTSMDNSYNSALMATGKILKNSLMNYI